MSYSNEKLARAIKDNHILLTEDCYSFLNRKGYDNLANIIGDSSNFGPSDCKCRQPAKCSNRPSMRKIGFFLECIESLGLLNEFEKYLKETGRTIRPSYGRFYRQHRDFGGQTPPLP